MSQEDESGSGLLAAAIGLGANMDSPAGPPERTLIAAIAALTEDLPDAAGELRVQAVSRLYRSQAVPSGSGPDFINAAALLMTNLSPVALLEHLHRVEARFARQRVVRWGMRSLDLDLLTLGEAILPDAATFCLWRDLDAEQQKVMTPERLILPHPRLQDRAFVLAPLAELQPNWRHPVLGLTVMEMLARLPVADRETVRPLHQALA